MIFFFFVGLSQVMSNSLSPPKIPVGHETSCPTTFGLQVRLFIRPQLPRVVIIHMTHVIVKASSSLVNTLTHNLVHNKVIFNLGISTWLFMYCYCKCY